MNDQLERVSNFSAFPAKLSGRAYARFLLTPGGEPRFEPDADDPTVRHYLIDLHFHSPKADEIDVVKYHLLDPGFARTFESGDEPNDFRAPVQTNSDSLIDVTADVMSILYRQRTTLSAMLEAGHAGTTNPAVREAIDRLKKLGG